MIHMKCQALFLLKNAHKKARTVFSEKTHVSSTDLKKKKKLQFWMALLTAQSKS